MITFDWENVGTVRRSLAGKLDIPTVPAAPGVYRFRTSGNSGTEVYIGESQDLQHRMRHNYTYAHTGKTNVRIRQTLLQHLAEGRDVRLAIVTKAVLEVDGDATLADLTSKDVRLLVENTALTLARRAGERIRNL